MDDKLLLKIALITSIMGIVILYFISSTANIPETKISKINELEESQTVKVTGKIKSISKTEKVTFIELTQEETVKIIVFNDRNLSLEKDENIEITGRITINNNNKENEIIADKIIIAR